MASRREHPGSWYFDSSCYRAKERQDVQAGGLVMGVHQFNSVCWIVVGPAASLTGTTLTSAEWRFSTQPVCKNRKADAMNSRARSVFQLLYLGALLPFAMISGLLVAPVATGHYWTSGSRPPNPCGYVWSFPSSIFWRPEQIGEDAKLGLIYCTAWEVYYDVVESSLISGCNNRTGRPF